MCCRLDYTIYVTIAYISSCFAVAESGKQSQKRQPPTVSPPQGFLVRLLDRFLEIMSFCSMITTDVTDPPVTLLLQHNVTLPSSFMLP